MYKIIGASHKGMVREHNEDRFAGGMLADNYGYALVCDGMGGEKGGSIASTLACDEIRRTLDTSYRADMDEKSVYNIMETAVANANTAVYQRARQEGDLLSGMGTTVSLAVLLGNTCYLANVGDSRAYLLHNGGFAQLTVDHTHVQALVDRGEITPEEAKTHPQRHYLTKAVGVEPSIMPYFRQMQLEPGDVLLLCSDGLYGMLDSELMAKLLLRVAKGGDCALLIDEANRHGGQDNVTAVVVASAEELTNG